MKSKWVLSVAFFCGVLIGNPAWALDWDFSGSLGDGPGKLEA